MGKNIANFWTETEGNKGELFSIAQLKRIIGGMPREDVEKMLTDMQAELHKQINDLTLYLTNDDPEEGEIGELLKIRANMEGMAEKIDEIMLFKFPNATIIGEPTIQNGQISGFSTMNYMQFPFILDLHNQKFQIDFCFTTATNVQTQQNILDSNFGLALAIQGGKGVMAISSNGTSWNIGSTTGTMNIQSNTIYYARLSWDGIQYKTFLSIDGKNYTQDMVLVGTQAPHPTTIFIGGCDQLETGHSPHPFLGTINLNKATLSVMGNVIWQGMDDAGLATRLSTDVANIDTAGIARLNELTHLDVTNLFIGQPLQGYTMAMIGGYNLYIIGRGKKIPARVIDSPRGVMIAYENLIYGQVESGEYIGSMQLVCALLHEENESIVASEVITISLDKEQE